MKFERLTDERGEYLCVETRRGHFFTIDAQDEHWLISHRWEAYYLPRSGLFYVHRTAGPRTASIALHRCLLNAPKGITVDHEDGNTFINRRYNIRLATDAQNQSNKHRTPGTASGYRGVYLVASGKFMAILSHDSQLYYLGTFDVAEDAARAYDAKAVELRGRFTYLNFPEEWR